MRLRTGLWTAAALAAVAAFATTGEAKTFRYATTGDILGLDPHINNEGPTNTMKGNVYGGLLHRKPDLSLEPELATEWERIDDTTWRFKLREGVTFHNGNPFNADDVVFSFKRQTQETSDMSFALSSVEDVKKIGDHEVEITTKGPDPILLLNMPNFFIVDQEFMEENNAVEVVRGAGKTNWANLNANGTGPFKVKEWVQDNRLVLERNPDYWGADQLTTNVTEAVFTPIPSDATRVAALLSGEIDLMYPVPLQDVQRLSQDPNVEVLQGPELRTIFLGFDQWRDELLDMPGSGKNPFKDVRVRKAFAHAIDLTAIQRVVMRGASAPTGLMIAPGINGFDESLNTPYEHDPELSKKLLAEAGYADGFPVTLDCPNDRYVNDEAICTSVVPMLERIGISVTLNAQTKSLHFNKIGSAEGNNTSFYMLGWTPGSYDALNMLQNIITIDGDGQGAWNSGRYSNPKVEELTDEIAVTVDEEERNAKIAEAMQIHKDDVGHLPLHQQALAWGVRSDTVEEVIQRPFNDVDLRYVTMK
ncbi:MAG: ABC transporter substrate-binding protein [Tistlia sp.]|uniref:ABC transporter substrate-binding protein n=1 Tax=Tistlia sp. TaxID=3057121 RepID=UPI0034A52FDA